MNTRTKAHGMDGTLVEPDWPPLALDEVRELLAEFCGCGEPIQIDSVSPRPFSAASVVSVAGGRVFVKRHHRTVRDAEGLLEEHRFLAHLLANGAAVPRVLAAKSGSTVVERDKWTYEVHEVPTDVDAYAEADSWTPFRCAEHARQAGAALARLHGSAETFVAPARRARPLVASFSIFAGDHPEAAVETYLSARPALLNDSATRRRCEEALDLLQPFHAELQPLLPSLPPLWTHNDLHASNLFWSSDGEDARATAVIDFGLADRTNAVHDLAHALERNIVEWLDLVNNPESPEKVRVHPEHLRALLDGYEAVCPLVREEAAALAPMTALCHAEFALAETDYFLGVLRSPEKAAMASDGYLLGHARWFRGAGATLLEAIRQWAESRPRESAGGRRR
ncbi:MAG TPA: phosphotransferase [Terracidiphilus sp.]|nr:phosphotransferase [Terracidiphilus sp.]